MSTRLLDDDALWDLTPQTVIPLWDGMQVTYLGEGLWESAPDDDDDDAFNAWNLVINAGTPYWAGESFPMADFESTYDRPNISGDFDGIMFGTYDSGWLIRMTRDEQGAYLFYFHGA